MNKWYLIGVGFLFVIIGNFFPDNSFTTAGLVIGVIGLSIKSGSHAKR